MIDFYSNKIFGPAERCGITGRTGLLLECLRLFVVLPRNCLAVLEPLSVYKVLSSLLVDGDMAAGHCTYQHTVRHDRDFFVLA